MMYIYQYFHYVTSATLGISARISEFPDDETLHCGGSQLKSHDDIAKGTGQ